MNLKTAVTPPLETLAGALACRSGRRCAGRWDVGQQRGPAVGPGQLLRNAPDVADGRMDIGDHRLDQPLAALAPGRQRDVVLDPAAQHHHPSRLAPAAESQLILDGLPALAGLGACVQSSRLSSRSISRLTLAVLRSAAGSARRALLAHVDDVFVAVAAGGPCCPWSSSTGPNSRWPGW